MSLYKALLIDIIYSLKKGNQDYGKEESKQFHSNQQNFALNYGIPLSLIDTMFEILEDQPIKFDPNLRSQKEFLHAKEQVDSLQNASEQDDFDPTITREEALQIENPIIRGIILEQQLIPKQNEPKYQILFIHLMFLSFPELRSNNSMMVKRKYVLLKLFEQSTYSYQPMKQQYLSRKTDEMNNKIDDQQDHIAMKDQTLISQVIEDKFSQDPQNSQQSLSIFKEKQPDSKAQNELKQLRGIFQMDQKRYYLSSDYPIEIEKLPSHLIKMKFSKVKQSVYTWSQLDLSSCFNLETTNPKAFYCWTSMLKLLNQKEFKAFINGQLRDSESDDEIVDDDCQIEQLLRNNNLSLDNIVRIDKRQSIVKFSNKVIIIEQFKLQGALKSIEDQIEIVNNLFTKKLHLDNQIELFQKQFHIDSPLEEWLEKQKQLESIVQTSETQSALNNLLLQQCQDPIPQYQFKSINLQKIDKAIQTSFIQPNDHTIEHDVNFEPEQANQNHNSVRTEQDYQGTLSDDLFKGINYHRGQYKFGKEYPFEIEILTKQKLLIKMKSNNMEIVEWWQFDYQSLKDLLSNKINLQAAETWSILLILIDEDQFFKLWKGEPIEQIQIKEEEEQITQKNASVQISEEYCLKQLPVTIIASDSYRYILKFRNCVQIIKKEMADKYLIQTYKEQNQKIVFRQQFYNAKIKMFRQLLLEQEKRKTKLHTLRQQISHEQKFDVQLKLNLDPELHTNMWIFDNDYPVRINQIDNDNLRFQFKNKLKNTIVQWKQLDYKSLIKLIDERINIRAGRAWIVMLILLDHDQFYKLWKNYHYRNDNQGCQYDDQQVNYSKQPAISDKRETPDYLPLRIIRLNELRVIVKFERYVQVFTNKELEQYRILMEIPDALLNNFRLSTIKSVYDQNLKAFEERLRLEHSQNEQGN